MKRAVSKSVVVVADAPNYIKGFRYQLFCEAKAAGTRSVVVHTAAREDECITWNNGRLEAWGWQMKTNGEEASIGNTTGIRTGKDVIGELQPESHTAVYGDAVLNEGPRSRSSSMGAAVSDDEEGQSIQRGQKDDTMTLKSLYISNKHVDRVLSTKEEPLDSVQEHAASAANTTYPLPSSNPPAPKASLPYSQTALKSLLMRYEPPSPFTRWDTPLFTIPSTDPHPPYDAIWSAIFPGPTNPTSKKALQRQRQEQEHAQKLQREAEAQTAPQSTSNSTVPSTKQDQHKVDSIRQNAATVLPTATALNALQLLESTTGEIVKLVLSAARASNAADGDGGNIDISVPIPGKDALEIGLEVPEGLTLSQPTLQRLRRKYTQIQRGGIAHGQGYTQGRRNIAEGFVHFLQAEWEGGV